MGELERLDRFIKRMSRLGINIQCVGNWPWCYIDSINGKLVKEKYQSEHGWVIGYLSVKRGGGFSFSDISEIFKLIRVYK